MNLDPMAMYEKFASGSEWSDISAHLRRLREYAHGNVLEIGVRGGLSTAALIQGVRENGGHVWSLDVVDCSKLYENPDWTFIQGHSVQDAERILEEELPPELALELLFLDSDHSFDTTSSELRLYGRIVRPNAGVILLHDTDLPGAGVRQALDEYAQQIGKTPVYHNGSYGLGELRP